MNKAWKDIKVRFRPDDAALDTLEGRVVSVDVNSIAIKLSRPINIGRYIDIEYAVASPRHVNKNVNNIKNGEAVLCMLIFVPSEKYQSSNPCSVAWWRGGGAAIGDVQVVPQYTIFTENDSDIEL